LASKIKIFFLEKGFNKSCKERRAQKVNTFLFLGYVNWLRGQLTENNLNKKIFRQSENFFWKIIFCNFWETDRMVSYTPQYRGNKMNIRIRKNDPSKKMTCCQPVKESSPFLFYLIKKKRIVIFREWIHSQV